MVQDITEQCLPTKRFRRARQAAPPEAVLGSARLSPAAIVTADLDDTVTVWNAAAQDALRLQPVEALGHNIDDLIAKSVSCTQRPSRSIGGSPMVRSSS